MDREKSLELLQENLQNKNLYKHCLAVGAGMKYLATHFQENETDWEICGFLHDIDYEQTHDNPEMHSKKGAEMLKQEGYSDEICHAVLAHNEIHGIEPESLMAKALYCVDPLTGLIIASTLVLPSKKISDVTTENVLNRFKEKAFARGANREIIAKCEELLDLSLERFVGIVLTAMQSISGDLGL